jgi:hypothetical protein
MLDDEPGGIGDHVTVSRPANHRLRRDDADRVARRQIRYIVACCLDNARRLETKPAGQGRSLDITARAQQRLGAVEAESLDADLNLARTRWRKVDILDTQNLGTAMLVESDNTCHSGYSKLSEPNGLCSQRAHG